MQIEGWKYYNHAAIPTTAPHQSANMEPLNNGSVWLIGDCVLLARWTSDWDCGYKTNWWYVIKDTPFDIRALKAKRRYEINKGNKNFIVRKINPIEHRHQLYEVTIAAYSSWPEKYRPSIDKESFFRNTEDWLRLDVFAGFSNEKGKLSGYALLKDYGSYVDFSTLRVDPECEKQAINAAMVAGILEQYKDRFNGQFYICDGARSIRHETAFQAYLEKYFDFRKAYCKLNIKYKTVFGILVNLLYPFRKFIKAESRLGSNISGILQMEEINRNS